MSIILIQVQTFALTYIYDTPNNIQVPIFKTSNANTNLSISYLVISFIFTIATFLITANLMDNKMEI